MQLSPTVLNVSIEGAPPEDTVAIYLERLPLEQLYHIEKEVQQEIWYREKLVHDELQVMEVERAHYMDLCTTLQKDKKEIIEQSWWLKILVHLVRRTVVIEEEYTVHHPIEDGLTKVKEVVQELRTKITDLEARGVPTTPPEDFSRREEALKEVVNNITAYEAECQDLYTQAIEIRNQWVEDEEL